MCQLRQIALSTLVVAAMSVAVVPLGAQARYAPLDRHPGVEFVGGEWRFEITTEVLAVVVSSSWCQGNAVEGFDVAIRDMKDALYARSDSAGVSFSAVGVATDWDVHAGLRYLMDGESTSGPLDFGPWGEVVVGRDFMNSAGTAFVFPHTEGSLAVPSVFILEREIIPQSTGVRVGKSRLLAEVAGGGAIVEWGREGFPVPDFPVSQSEGPEGAH